MAFTAMELTFKKHWLSIWIESDSTYVVYVLRNRTLEVPWRLLARWHRVCRLLGHMTMVVSHIFREGNASAEKLTWEPVDSFEWWDHVPAFLDSYLRRDRHEKFYRFSNF
ncbi:hypothetical protein ACS0TY_033774 [Phlomoides rotata]